MTLTLLILLLTLALSFLTLMPDILTLVSGSLSLIWWPRFKISAATTSADFELSLMSLVPHALLFQQASCESKVSSNQPYLLLYFQKTILQLRVASHLTIPSREHAARWNHQQ
jgi:hypothetical protein